RVAHLILPSLAVLALAAAPSASAAGGVSMGASGTPTTAGTPASPGVACTPCSPATSSTSAAAPAPDVTAMSGGAGMGRTSTGLSMTSMDSSDYEPWGQLGVGHWITVYTNPGHAFVQIAGIRLDTSAEQDPHPAPGTGPRWRPIMASAARYMARHPVGL